LKFGRKVGGFQKILKEVKKRTQTNKSAKKHAKEMWKNHQRVEGSCEKYGQSNNSTSVPSTSSGKSQTFWQEFQKRAINGRRTENWERLSNKLYKRRRGRYEETVQKGLSKLCTAREGLKTRGTRCR